MLELMEICNQFKADSSKKGKQALLQQYINDDRFKRYLQYILEPSYTYGLQDKKIKKYLGKSNGESEFDDLFDVFEYLLVNNTGTDETAQKVAQFIDGYDDDMQRFLLESICKKMKLGITAKTINDVYGKEFITNLEIMLAKKYEDECHKIEGKEIIITEKYDGQRCIFIKRGNEIKAKSREAIDIIGLVDIEQEIAKLPDGMYDGELLCYNHEQLKDRDVLQETLKITRKDGNKTGLFFYLFDYLTLEDLDKGKSKDDYSKRRDFLESCINSSSFKEVILVPILYKGTDHSVIVDMIAEMNNKGREGLMVNVSDSPYVCKRTHHILKIKTMETADLRVIGFEKGKPLGKYKNTLGTLYVDYKSYKLGVSGFSDEMRDEIWNNQDKYLGRIVEVSYFRESKNAEGGLSVSFAQFKGWRFDKTEPSYY